MPWVIHSCLLSSAYGDTETGERKRLRGHTAGVGPGSAAPAIPLWAPVSGSLLFDGQDKPAQEQPTEGLARAMGSARGPGLCVISPTPHSGVWNTAFITHQATLAL